MANFNPTDISNWSGGEWTKLPDSFLAGFCIDSRTANSDELFVALRAERDGHQFLEQAIACGAVGGIVDHLIENVNCPQLVVPDTLSAFQQVAQRHRGNFSGMVPPSNSP